jgi:hypothetical protein
VYIGTACYFTSWVFKLTMIHFSGH